MLIQLVFFFTVIANEAIGEEFLTSERKEGFVPDCVIDGSCWADSWFDGAEAAYGCGKRITAGPVIVTSAQEVDEMILQRQAEVDACEKEFPYDPENPLDPKHLSCTFTSKQIDQMRRYTGPEHILGAHKSPLVDQYWDSEKGKKCMAFTDILEAHAGGKIALRSEALSYAFHGYRESCFLSGDSIDEDIFSRLAFLVDFEGDRASSLICAGVIFSPELVLTARHCFVSLCGSAEEERLQPQKNLGARIVAPGYEPHIFNYEIENERLPVEDQVLDIADPTTDWILLRVNGLAPDVEQLPVGVLDEQKRDFLKVPGIFADTRSLNHAIDEDNLPAEVRKQAVIEKSPACHVVSLRNGCLVHSCQTMKSFSGSPIFSVEDGVNKLSGLHLGYMGPQDNVCDFRRSSIISNRGIPLADLLLDPKFSSLVWPSGSARENSQ